MNFDYVIYVLCMLSFSALIAHIVQLKRMQSVNTLAMSPISLSVIFFVSILIMSYCINSLLHDMYTGSEIKIPVGAYLYLFVSIVIVYIHISMSWQYMLVDNIGNMIFIGMNPFKKITVDHSQISIPENSNSGVWILCLSGEKYTTTINCKHVYQCMLKSIELSNLRE